MNSPFADKCTLMLSAKINDWGLDKIYEIEDNLDSLEESTNEIVEYLKDIKFSMPLGLALRRYICNKYCQKIEDGDFTYSYTLSNQDIIKLKDYMLESYNFSGDEIKEYAEIFEDINCKYNSDGGKLCLDFPKNEIKRMLKKDTHCSRDKMFLISFALHMDNENMQKFLTDILAEQTYNYRNPYEIIAYFCQSNEQYNSYCHFIELKNKYENSVSNQNSSTQETEDYTFFAKSTLKNDIKSENELMTFLLSNTANFNKYSSTAYNEFCALYDKALELTKIQSLSNDDYITDEKATTVDKFKEKEERINNAIELKAVTNSEQLAKEMLSCIPRCTKKYTRNNKTIYENDFINVSNNDNNTKSKKIKTTILPREITMNLPMRDRLDNLLSKKKAVERKDLVFMKFYVFSKYLEDKGEYTASDYNTFKYECDDMLVRCGFSKLYPANRFENLVLLSLLASNPFEMFETIIEYSFFSEPDYKSQK